MNSSKLVIIFVLLSMLTGCQIMEIKYTGTLAGDVEMSKTISSTGRHAEGWSTSWYIFDLGPVYEATVSRAMDGEVGHDASLDQVVITTEFDALDTPWRILQMAFIGLPAIGSRTVYVEGKVRQRSAPLPMQHYDE